MSNKKPASKVDIEKVQEELRKLQADFDEMKNRLARALADYQNLEKRTVAEKEGWVKFAGAEVVTKLLPTLDTLRKAQVNSGGDDGLALAVKQFETALGEVGVSPIVTAGQMFDPNIMECTEVVEGAADGQVAEEVQSGYYYFDKLLRPARVKVYKRKVPEEPAGAAEEHPQS